MQPDSTTQTPETHQAISPDTKTPYSRRRSDPPLPDDPRVRNNFIIGFDLDANSLEYALQRMASWSWGIDRETDSEFPFTGERSFVLPSDFEHFAAKIEGAIANARKFYAARDERDLREWNVAVQEQAELDHLVNQCRSWKHTSGVVYVVAGRDGLHKIGQSKNVEKRIRSLELGYIPEIVHTIASDHITFAELYFHGQLNDVRREGEWFALTDEDITWLRSFERFDYPAEEGSHE